MSHSLRYHQADICDHLASQYVTGTLTHRVRARVEALLPTSPELQHAVDMWAQRMSEIDYHMPEAQVRKTHWQAIHSRISPQTTPSETSLWQRLAFWQWTSAIAITTSLVLFMAVFSPALSPALLPPSSVPFSTPSYVAAMSAPTQQNDEIHFVVNAYKKTENQPSRLFVQWSKRHPRTVQEALHIWAEDNDTGEIHYIGIEPEKGSPWFLQKAQWQAVANSRRLLATTNQNLPSPETTIFSGPCIQLSEWVNKQNII